jgi:single-strand DNA-binding protein
MENSMFDTYVTVVGNVLTAPEWRRTSQSNTLVANFKVASTARRLDRENNRWVDGNSLRVRVNCWRRLAEGVAASVMVGDPVVVVGRMYTRDWVDGDGNHRAVYELEAVAVGHDLSRGRGRFIRNRPMVATSSVEDAESEARVHGEETEPVPDSEAPVVPGDQPFGDEDEDFAEAPVSPAAGGDTLRSVRGFGAALGQSAPAIEAQVPTGRQDPGIEHGAPGEPTDQRERPDQGERHRGKHPDQGERNQGERTDLGERSDRGESVQAGDQQVDPAGDGPEPARGRRGRVRTAVPA